MTSENNKEKIAIPEGVQVTFVDGIITTKGPKGEASMKLVSGRLTIVVEGNNVALVKTESKVSKKDKMFMNTFKAHINNLLLGVTEGFVYKLKICSGHFPMNVSLKGNVLEVKNFLGESVPRKLIIKDGVKVNLTTDIITVEGTSKELVGTVSGDIEQLTRVTNRDRRIFQDGIYIIDKSGKAM